MVISREQARAAKGKRRFGTVEIPGLGTARVQSLSAKEWAEIENAQVKPTKGGGARLDLRSTKARIVAKCWVDESGVRIFEDDELGEIQAISNEIIEPIAELARELSGIKRVEEVAEELDADPNSVSPTTSPSPAGSGM